MKIINGADLDAMGRVMEFTPGGFLSHRFLLEQDGMGYTVTRTVIPPKGPQRWEYPNHLEACYCVAGRGELVDLATGTRHDITPDTLYALDHNDAHTFEAIDGPVTLICVFSPALRGDEAHKDGHDYGRNDYRSPVYNVRSVPIDKVTANDYNPNSVAPPEMELLETSIWEDGYTQPVVTVYDAETDKYVVVDGFHRFLTLKNSARIRERENGMLPVVVLEKDMSDRMASTIRHNRARGSHNIELMSQIVAELVEMGKGDRWICEHIGMSPDELLRMKQITGLASLFATTASFPKRGNLNMTADVMRQVYHPVQQWEEIAHNMWGKVTDRAGYLQRAIEFTSDHKRYGHYMRRVAAEWPISTENALTDPHLNHRAWIGHAACALAMQCPEDIVRQAWSYLTDEQKLLANKEASRAIADWRRTYIAHRSIRGDMAEQVLPGFDT